MKRLLIDSALCSAAAALVAGNIESAAYCTVLPKGEAPKVMMLVPAGKVTLRDSRDPREPWLNDQPDAVAAASNALIKNGMSAGLPIDYDHATELAAPHGGPAPAAAWMRDFFVQNGEVWAHVDWTESGAKAAASGEWAYLSPVFDFTKKDRRVVVVRNAAMTNNPALYGMAIAAAKSRERSSEMKMTAEQFRTKMAALFGVDEKNLVALCGGKDGEKMDSDDFCARMAAYFGCAKGSSHEDVCAAAEKHFKKAKAGSEGKDDMDKDEMAAKLIASGEVVAKKDYDALLKDVNQIKSDQATARAAAKVDGVIHDKKLLVSQRDWAIAYCARDEKGFDEFVSKQVPMDLGPSSQFRGTPPKPGTPEAGLSAQERAVLSSLATVSAEGYAKQKGKALNLEIKSQFGGMDQVNLGKE